MKPCPVARARRGISLLEILIATFVLAIGLLGLAALLPVGRFAILEAGKCDRAGACGRAALRDVKVREMLDYTLWWPAQDPDGTDIAPFAIDPLGVEASLGQLGGAGGIDRITLNGWTPSMTEQVFTWQDDLVFDMPEDVTMRPSIMTTGLDSQGDYSWFITVTPAANENDRTDEFGNVVPGVQLRDKSLFSVSVVVCYKRDLGLDASNNPTGELSTGATIVGGFGGGSITLGTSVEIREDEWIMLYHADSGQCHWYRVVAAGASPTDQLSLTGPDWNLAGNPATAVVIQSVIGVYTTTIEVER